MDVDRNKYTIVVPHSIQFYSMYQRPQAICVELAKLGYNVVFCDGLFIEEIGKTVLYNSYPSGGKLHICYNINKYVESLGDPAEANHIFYFSYGKTAGTGKFIKAMFSIWDYLDDFPSNRLYDKTAMLNADAITCTAKILYEKAQEKFDGPVRWIENGCNPDLIEQIKHFYGCKGTSLEVPDPWLTDSYPDVPNKHLTYIGAIAPWVAWKHLFKFADYIKDKAKIHFVGKHFYFGNEFNGVDLKYLMEANPNIHDCGHVDYHNLVPYYACTDCFLLPFVTAQTTDKQAYLDIMAATNPIKFWDYLATGKPIISSRLPEIVRLVEEHDLGWVFFADTFEEMKVAYDDYIMNMCIPVGSYDDKIARRKAFAAKNTWTQRAQQLDDLIVELLEQGVDHRKDTGMMKVL